MVAMYVEVVPNHGSRPSVLLREGWREGGKVRKRTIANLTHWPSVRVEALRAVLRGHSDNGLAAFECVRSRHHGHVQAVGGAMSRLGFDGLISSRPCRDRNLVLAMIAAQLLHPQTKLATTRCWHTTTLAETFGVTDCDENDLYAALDWLLSRQQYIEKKLAARHLKDGGLVLYDLSSSYFEGKTCPLAALGHNRDGKKGKLQVNYGLLTDARGCPVAVTVFKGNTADPKTLLPQIEKITKPSRRPPRRASLHTASRRCSRTSAPLYEIPANDRAKTTPLLISSPHRASCSNEPSTYSPPSYRSQQPAHAFRVNLPKTLRKYALMAMELQSNQQARAPSRERIC
jgi:hypothetical protein